MMTVPAPHPRHAGAPEPASAIDDATPSPRRGDDAQYDGPPLEDTVEMAILYDPDGP